MSSNGRALVHPEQAHVLRWPGRVLAAADLQRHLNGHRAVVLGPWTVVTPLAGEELRQGGVELRREPPSARPAPEAAWGCGQDRPHTLVQSAVQALRREGLGVEEWPLAGDDLPCRWARS